MRIGLAYDLKKAISDTFENAPEDALEEYDSEETVSLLADAITDLGHTPVRLGGGREFLNGVLSTKVDFVFNIAEGRGAYRSREAQVPSVLEMLGVPYSGSDPQTLTIALDKLLTKEIITRVGVRTPACLAFSHEHELEHADWSHLNFPVFIKPAWEGSSKGVRLSSAADSPSEAIEKIKAILRLYRQPVMAEEFINGEELTVGVIGNDPREVLGPLHVVPRTRSERFIYSLEVKRDWEQLVDYVYPAQLPQAVIDEMKDFSLKVFQALGCRDFARLDFRVSQENKAYFLEINPLPGLALSSDLYILTTKMGWTHAELIQKILRVAIARYSL